MSDGGKQFQSLFLGSDFAGFTIDFFAAGTTTGKDVYHDEAGATSTQQITADSLGMAFWYADGDYRLRIKDSDGILLWDWPAWKMTSDTATMWEGNFGLAYPAAISKNLWQLFAKIDASNNFQELGINDGDSFNTIVDKNTFDGSHFNVKYSVFGALGDGSTDDTSAIQAAIDAVTSDGGIVFFPPGTYIISSTLNVPDKIYLLGSGVGTTIIKSATNMNADMISLNTSNDYFLISDLRIDGNRANQSGSGPYDGITTGGTTNTKVGVERLEVINIKGVGLDLINISKLRVRDVLLKDGGVSSSNLTALFYTGSNNVLIDNVEVDTWYGNGIFGANNETPITQKRVWIINCYVHDLDTGSDTTAQGISAGSYQEVRCDNNIVENVPASGFDINSNKRMWIRGNTVENSGSGQEALGIEVTSLAGTIGNDAEYFFVTDNLLIMGAGRNGLTIKGKRGTAKGNFVLMDATTPGSNALTVQHEGNFSVIPQDVTVIGNTLIGAGVQGGSNTGDGIAVFGRPSVKVDNVVIDGNIVRGFNQGFWANQADYVTIKNNHIVENTTNYADGGDNTKIIIEGNNTDFVAFDDGDDTPSIADGGELYRTANTSSTTITDFDGIVTANRGRKFTLIINDANTIIDFTSTNLKGNAGVDWSPIANDHMTCIWNGQFWFCIVSDNTA